jgi:diguanylate cyclase (GGDEF)-like protein
MGGGLELCRIREKGNAFARVLGGATSVAVFSRRQANSVQKLADLGEAERLRLALAASGDVVYDWTPGDGRMVWTGEPSAHLGCGSAEQYASDATFHSLIDQDAVEARLRLVLTPPADGAPFRLEYSMKTNGAPVWVEDCGVCLPGADGHAERIVGLLRNVTERKLREEHLAWAASYDEMTGHLNRLRLREQLAQHLELKAAAEREPAAYCVAAIDDLAIINETYGFDVADEVIVAVGRRLADVAGPSGVIGRTAGNKFGLIIERCTAGDMAERVGVLRDVVRSRVIPTRGGAVSVSVSVGAVALPQDARNSQEAMARAEEALDRAKAHGRDNFAAYSHSPQRESLRKRTVAIGDQIITALSENRVVLAYQSIVDAKTSEAVAHECLVRIARPEGQVIQAGDFVPVAEQLGLVRRLDRRVLELTIASLKKYKGARLSLNVSGMTASDRPTLEQFVAYLENHTDVAPRLIVELTETAALLDIEESMRFVSRVRALGAKVAIDDFGAGYTSFRNLQSLKVDMVKIDGTFVKGMADNRDNQIFVRTLADLAKNFSLSTVAEWVSDPREADILRAFGVDYLQGFLFSKPEIREPWTN